MVCVPVDGVHTERSGPLADLHLEDFPTGESGGKGGSIDGDRTCVTLVPGSRRLLGETAQLLGGTKSRMTRESKPGSKHPWRFLENKQIVSRRTGKIVKVVLS